MKTESAENLNEFMNHAYDCYTNYCFKTKQDAALKDVEKQRFHRNVFINLFNYFVAELQENIRTYRDIDIIKDYVDVNFSKLLKLEAFHEDENKWTIERGYEVHFLLNFRKNIEYYIDELRACVKTDQNIGSFATSLMYYFNQEKDNNFTVVSPEAAKIIAHVTEYAPEDRFRFSDLKNECSKFKHNIEKIKFINERLFDFEQWQVQYDKLIFNKDVGQYYEYTAHFYSDFEKLCSIELKRLEKLIEIELRMPVNVATTTQQNEPSLYKWNANDTDLLELVAAMHESDSVKRTDGKKLTQKELFEYFQGIFNVKLNNIHSTLNKAGNRKTGITPYLNRLITAFENYVQEKEEKLTKRR